MDKNDKIQISNYVEKDLLNYLTDNFMYKKIAIDSTSVDDFDFFKKARQCFYLEQFSSINEIDIQSYDCLVLGTKYLNDIDLKAFLNYNVKIIILSNDYIKRIILNNLFLILQWMSHPQ